MLKFPENIGNHNSLAIQIHIFHEEYIPKVAKYFNRLNDSDLFISVPDLRMKHKLESSINRDKKLEIRVVQNKGRNFAPLFVEFGNELSNYDLVLHLHSKSSQNSFKRKKWAISLWNHLLLNDFISQTAVSYFAENHKIGLYFPTDFRWYPKSEGWSGTELLSKKFFPELTNDIESSSDLKFPVGGMFLTRGSNISYISKVIDNWEYFPEEENNQDAIVQGITLEHSLERLIAQVNISQGFDTLIYDCNRKTFEIHQRSRKK
jgi:lipopolysaccharide biosynthesis protein